MLRVLIQILVMLVPANLVKKKKNKLNISGYIATGKTLEWNPVYFTVEKTTCRKWKKTWKNAQTVQFSRDGEHDTRATVLYSGRWRCTCCCSNNRIYYTIVNDLESRRSIYDNTRVVIITIIVYIVHSTTCSTSSRGKNDIISTWNSVDFFFRRMLIWQKFLQDAHIAIPSFPNETRYCTETLNVKCFDLRFLDHRSFYCSIIFAIFRSGPVTRNLKRNNSQQLQHVRLPSRWITRTQSIILV